MPTVFDVKTAQKHKALHAFCYRPNVRFEEQQDGEEVMLLLRAHPVTQIPWVVTAIVLALVPLIITVFLASILGPIQIIFLNFFWYSIVFGYVLLNILDWTFNAGIVTNRRVLDVNYSIIINRQITATTMQDIVDATSSSIGFFPSVFNYGNVYAQTPGTTQGIEFNNVPRPSEVVTIINQLMEQQNPSL